MSDRARRRLYHVACIDLSAVPRCTVVLPAARIPAALTLPLDPL